MIKILFCLRRLPPLTLEEFHAYWRNTHAPLVLEHAPAMRIRRYVQNHTFTHEHLQLSIDIRKSAVAAYDGVAELWWDSLEDLFAALKTDEARTAGRILLEDERKFIDLKNSPMFYAKEHIVVS